MSTLHPELYSDGTTVTAVSTPLLAPGISQASHTGNDAENAVSTFCAKHKLTEGGGDDLLRLVKHLASPETLQSTRALPITMATFRRRMNASTHDASTVNTIDISAANGDVSERLPFVDIASAIQDLLMEDIADEEKWLGSASSTTAGYGEAWTGQWWREASAELSEMNVHISRHETTHGGLSEGATEDAGSRAVQSQPVLLGLIFYVDGINVDFFGNVQLVPIMLTLGNFSVATRQKMQAKRVISLVPHLSNEQIASKTRVAPSRVRRELMHGAFQK